MPTPDAGAREEEEHVVQSVVVGRTGGPEVLEVRDGVPVTVAQAPTLAARGGRVVIVGVLAAGTRVEVEPFDLLFREVSLLTAFVNPFTQSRALALLASVIDRRLAELSAREAAATARSASAAPPSAPS